MILINLLSPEQKEEIKNKRLYMTVKETIMLILLFTAIVGILLVAAKYILDQQLANLIMKNAMQIQASQEKNNQILAINKKIDTVTGIQNNFIKWSKYFIDLSQATPDNIYYNFLKIYYQDATAELEGVAKTRGDLSQLKTRLENSGLFENVKLPLADLLAKENNIFHIKAKINLSRLTNE